MYKSMVINLNSKRDCQNPEDELVSTLNNMNFNVWHDLGKIDESIEILWIEVKGRNKNTLVLIGVVYQPSANETENLIWL